MKHKLSHWKKNNSKLTYVLFKIIIIVCLLIFLAKYKPLIIVIVFEVLDFFKTVLKQAIPFTPIDFEFIFGITVSYFYSPLLGVLIFCLSVINRTVLACIEIRHLTKSLRHLPLYFLIVLFRGTNFFAAAMIMLALNYILKYALNFLKGDYSLDKSPYNIANIIVSVICFYLIYSIYSYFPFLA